MSNRRYDNCDYQPYGSVYIPTRKDYQNTKEEEAEPFSMHEQQ